MQAHYCEFKLLSCQYTVLRRMDINLFSKMRYYYLPHDYHLSQNYSTANSNLSPTELKWAHVPLFKFLNRILVSPMSQKFSRNQKTVFNTFIFKLRKGASITHFVVLSVCLSVPKKCPK